MWCFNNERKVDNSSTPDMFLGRLFHKPTEAGKKKGGKKKVCSAVSGGNSSTWHKL